MGYATLAQAKEWCRSGYGQCDNSALLRTVNRIRQHMYSWYESLPLFLDAIECFEVQSFPLACDDCQEWYRGVTLPPDFQTIEAMWWQDFPVTLRSSWREWQTGLSHECDCNLQKFDLPAMVSTFADILPLQSRKLFVRAFDAADEGKMFTVRGTSAGGAPFAQTFGLSTSTQETSEALRSVSPRGGVVKEPTVGRVVLQESTGRVIGMYEPFETVPSYKRIKITGIPDNCQHVNIRAARRYMPVLNDSDVVETDQEIAWDAMARYLRLYERADKSSEDFASMKMHAAAAKALVTGQVSREVGNATRTELKVTSPTFFSGRSGLNRGGGRW